MSLLAAVFPGVRLCCPPALSPSQAWVGGDGFVVLAVEVGAAASGCRCPEGRRGAFWHGSGTSTSYGGAVNEQPCLTFGGDGGVPGPLRFMRAMSTSL